MDRLPAFPSSQFIPVLFQVVASCVEVSFQTNAKEEDQFPIRMTTRLQEHKQTLQFDQSQRISNIHLRPHGPIVERGLLRAKHYLQ